MLVEKLAQIAQVEGTDYFISFSNGDSINNLKGKKCAVFKVKDFAEVLLTLKSAKVENVVLCSTDNSFAEREVLGFHVVNTWELIEEKTDCYFLIPPTNEVTRDAILRQLLLNGVEEFGVIQRYRFPEFSQIPFGEKLKENLIKSIEKMINYRIEDVGIYNALCNKDPHNYIAGVSWWNKIYKWLFEDITSKDYKLSMLDIGPGMGLFSILALGLASNNNIAIDWINYCDCVSYSSAIAENSFIFNIETGDLPVDKQYDLIVMTEVIEHFSYNPIPTLRKITSWLKPDGVFYLSCPHWTRHMPYKSYEFMPEPGSKLPFDYHNHIYEYTHEELLEMCDKAGLEVVREDFSLLGNSNLSLKRKLVKA